MPEFTPAIPDASKQQTMLAMNNKPIMLAQWALLVQFSTRSQSCLFPSVEED